MKTTTITTTTITPFSYFLPYSRLNSYYDQPRSPISNPDTQERPLFRVLRSRSLAVLVQTKNHVTVSHPISSSDHQEITNCPAINLVLPTIIAAPKRQLVFKSAASPFQIPEHDPEKTYNSFRLAAGIRL